MPEYQDFDRVKIGNRTGTVFYSEFRHAWSVEFDAQGDSHYVRNLKPDEEIQVIARGVRPGWFKLDDGPSVRGYARRSEEDWNGAAIPYFTEAELDGIKRAYPWLILTLNPVTEKVRTLNNAEPGQDESNLPPTTDSSAWETWDRVWIYHAGVTERAWSVGGGSWVWQERRSKA